MDCERPVAQWKPEWHMELADVQDTQRALRVDALRSTRAIRTNVSTPAQINEVFDAIAYEKSAAVLRTIETYLGEEMFRRAVSSYLRKFSFSNAAAEDFWTEVTRVSGKPVDRVLASYVDQPGVPVVSVSAQCAGSSTPVHLTQERFSGAPQATPIPDQTWTFPICFKAFPDSPARCDLISGHQQTLTLPGCADEAFINAGSLGYFVTAYSPDTVRALGRKARGTLTPAERLGLLQDEWWMALSGRHDIGEFLTLAASLASDTMPAVTEVIATHLTFAEQYVVAPAQRAQLHGWIQQRFQPALTALGFPGTRGDDEDKELRRATLLRLLGDTADTPEVQSRARDVAAAYLSDPTSLSGTLADAVLSVAAHGGDAALYDRYVSALRQQGADTDAYYRYFNALPDFRDRALVLRTLDFALSADVRTQDTGSLIASLLARPWARDFAWEFVTTNWGRLTQRLGTFQGVPTIIGALGNFCSAEMADEVGRFFQIHPVPTSQRALAQAIERMQNCAAVARRQAEPMGRWLETRR